MNIVAVDPGMHCGLALRMGDGSLNHSMIDTGLGDVLKFLSSVQPQVIVVERFVTAGRIARSGLDTVEMQGAIFGVGFIMGSQIYVQSPIDRMPFIPEARKLISAGRSKIESHALDAVAHLLRWEYMESKGRQRKPLM